MTTVARDLPVRRKLVYIVANGEYDPLSLEEELTTIILNWLFKIIFFSWTLIYCYNQREEQTMSIERRRETKLISNFD